jgi:hypothetical protein
VIDVANENHVKLRLRVDAGYGLLVDTHRKPRALSFCIALRS